MLCNVDEEVLLNIAKRLAKLEMFVKEEVIGDCTTDEYCRKEFDRMKLEMLLHDLSLDYCNMLKDAYFQMTFSTYDFLIDIGYFVRENNFFKRNNFDVWDFSNKKEDVKSEKVKGD